MKIVNYLLKEYGVVLFFSLIVIVLAIANPDYLSFKKTFYILRQASIIGIISVGITFVILGGGFDISVGSTMVLSGTVVLWLLTYFTWPYAIVLTLLVGIMIGLFNGALIIKLKASSLLITFATMSIIRGLIYISTGGYPIRADRELAGALSFLGRGKIASIPMPVIIFFTLAILGQIILTQTKIGRYTLGIGYNQNATRLSGVNVSFYRILTFTFSGLTACIAGILFGGRLLTISPIAGQGYEIDAIAAVLIGGTSIYGGEGSIFKTVIGVILLTIITGFLNIMGLTVYVQYLIKGAIILFAISLELITKRKNQLRLQTV